ncbi:MAG: metal-dependent transcriptional regulator [Rhodothermales bacterium]|nr:metal-dependent transcriptional regulator [Rhodothermales bacterium]
MLSQAVEDYLKTIYKLQGEDRVATNHIAAVMEVSSASVTNMLKRLTRLELVDYASYQGVRLTEAGTQVALEIIRHHRLLETYLKEVMGFSWSEMHEEAERLEHHISEEFEERIDEMLGYPTHDPHGHPIPTKDGKIAASATQTLAETEPGEHVVVHHVSDGDSDLLDYLEGAGLLPQSKVQVVEKEPFNGPLKVALGGKERVIGREVAAQVFVRPAIHRTTASGTVASSSAERTETK